MKRKIAAFVTFIFGLYFLLEFVLPAKVGGSFDHSRLGYPYLLAEDEGAFLYYCGFYDENRPFVGVAIANGERGKWEKWRGNPVLKPTMWFSRDFRGLWTPCVLREPNGTYTMWYVGTGADNADSVCRATSRDGLRWRKRGTVLRLARVLGERPSLRGLAVIRDGSLYRMFFSGTYRINDTFVTGVSVATSPDGITWSLAPYNPILTPDPESWDATEIGSLSVVKDNDGYTLWYGGVRQRVIGNHYIPFTKIGVATSPDGHTWTKRPDPVLAPPRTLPLVAEIEVLPDDEVARLYQLFHVTPDPDPARARFTLIGFLDVLENRFSDWLPLDTPTVARQLEIEDIKTEEEPAAALARLSTALVKQLNKAPDEGETRFDRWNIDSFHVARNGDNYVMTYAGVDSLGSRGHRLGQATSPDGLAWTRVEGRLPSGALLSFGAEPQPTYLSDIYNTVTDFIIVLGGFALGIGIMNLGLYHARRLVRLEKEWYNSAVFFVGLIGTFVITMIGYRAAEQALVNTIFVTIRDGMLVPFGAMAMGILAFYLASAAYRAFKLKTAEAGLMMITAAIIMLGQVPIGQWITHNLPIWLQVQSWSGWISYVIVSASLRAINIGVAVGALVIAIRLWLSLERRGER